MTEKETKDYGSYIMQMVSDLATVKQTTVSIETVIDLIFAQTTKTNGRVSKLEDTVATHSAKILLTDAVDAAALLKANWWRDKIGTALIGIFFTVIGGIVVLVLQKTDIIDVSTVSSADYDRIDLITDYESNPE